MKHVAEPLIRRNVPHYPAELPKLNMVVPGPQISFPVSTMPAFTVTHRGTLPAITSKKCQSRLAKVNTGVLHTHQAFYIFESFSHLGLLGVASTRSTVDFQVKHTADRLVLNIRCFKNARYGCIKEKKEECQMNITKQVPWWRFYEGL